MAGALGRVACLAGVIGLIGLAGDHPGVELTAAFFLLWTAYAFVSGIVAVPYNDIVARTIASAHRSRMLAIRFFGGGLLALAVAGAADRLLADLPFPVSYAAVLGLGTVLLLISALSFISAGEPEAPPSVDGARGFIDFMRDGVAIVRIDRRFRLFLYAQWLSGAVAMALPFYILQVTAVQGAPSSVAFLLGAQTAGTLLSNPFWGWLGDLRGKRVLLEAVAATSMLAPLLMLAWLAIGGGAALAWFTAIFVLLGAVGNGGTIAQLGYLMEISLDDRRPADSGYFNGLVAPAALLPLAGAAIVEVGSYAAVFAVSGVAASLQLLVVRRLRDAEGDGGAR